MKTPWIAFKALLEVVAVALVAVAVAVAKMVDIILADHLAPLELFGPATHGNSPRRMLVITNVSS